MTEPSESLKEAVERATAATTQLSNAIASVDSNTVAYGGGYPINNANYTIQQGNGTSTFGPMIGGSLYPSTTTPGMGIEYGQFDPCPMGHIANSDDVEYSDGVIQSHCITCGARMQVNKVSGGVALLRIQYLLGRVMSIDDETRELEGFDLGQILSDYSEIVDTLEKEEFALRQARKLVDLTTQVLNTKVASDTE